MLTREKSIKVELLPSYVWQMPLYPLALRSVRIGGSKVDHIDVGRRPDLGVVCVVTVLFHAGSIDVLSDLIVDVDCLVIVFPSLCIKLNKDVVGLDVPVNVAQRMQALNALNHLDAKL